MEKYGMAMVKTSWTKANEDNKKDDYSSIIPSGFKQQKYDTTIVPGGYLYHRCHLIAWKIGGIDVDERNLITGTQNFNIKGMKQFEDKVYNYLKENQTNHVLYRVTPYFEVNNELANGVNIEAYSIEDKGKLKFNVYVYNAQDGIFIDYATGESKLLE
jgi:DNA-entry nuclease